MLDPKHRARKADLRHVDTPTALSNFANMNLAIEYRALTDLHMPARQLRKHKQRQIEQIAASIRQFGFNDPVLIDDDDRIVAGVGRALAAPLVGLARIPVMRLSHLTPEEVRAYAIAENRLAERSEWDSELLALELGELSALDLDFDLELTGFDTAQIDIMITSTEAASNADDDVVEPAVGPPVSQPGDLWQLGSHRLLCGDSRERASYQRVMGDDHARMVFTDPPYNVRIEGNVCGLGSVAHTEFAMASGEMSDEEFTQFLAVTFGHMAAASVDGAIHFACMDWRHMGEMLAAGHQHYSELKNLIVWNKDNAGMGTFYRSKHELVFVWKVGDAPHLNTFGLGASGRYRTNVWDYAGINSISPNRTAELAMHPTVKPVAMVADAIKDCSRRGDIVLDPFCGSGTTIIAAERTGRVARAIEYDPKYVDGAVCRWQQRTGGVAIHVDTGMTLEDLAACRGAPGEATS